MPYYIEASDTLNADKIKLAKVDIVDQPELKEAWGIDGYPTYKIFKNGVPRDFKTKSPDAIVYEMRKSRKTALVQVSTKYDLERLTESDMHVIVGVFESKVRCARSTEIYTRECIEFHAFAPPLEALPCVRPMAFLSGVHSSYRLAL
jgi:hypothetical protein